MNIEIDYAKPAKTPYSKLAIASFIVGIVSGPLSIGIAFITPFDSLIPVIFLPGIFGILFAGIAIFLIFNISPKPRGLILAGMGLAASIIEPTVILLIITIINKVLSRAM